jgi:hypothetical protein
MTSTVAEPIDLPTPIRARGIPAGTEALENYVHVLSKLMKAVMNTTEIRPETTTWPEFAERLHGFLTCRGATIEYGLDQLEILVPRHAADNSPRAKWQLNGTIRIRTSEKGQ